MTTVQQWGRKESIIWPPRGFYYSYGAIFLAVVIAGFLMYVHVRFSFSPLKNKLRAVLHPNPIGRLVSPHRNVPARLHNRWEIPLSVGHGRRCLRRRNSTTIRQNESSTVGSVRSINTAEISYNAAYPSVGFGTSLANLGSPVGTCTPTTTHGCFIDNVLSSGTKSGYTFTLAATGGPPQTGYQVAANPVTNNQTGVRSFCSYEDAVIRYSTSTGLSDTTCTGAASPLQ
jgi:hypothetical protein